MSQKKELTIYVENRTWELIEECLEDGTQLDVMRDLWYEMKADYVVTSNKGDANEEDYSDKVTAIIRNTFARYAEGDQSVYTRLGLHSRILVKGEVPIVVIFEKRKKAALSIVNKFSAGYAFAEGQFPTFESVHVANYFQECGYRIGYVFVVTDYDPAGYDMYNQIKVKMDKFTDGIDISTVWVEYGDAPVDEFSSYELKQNKINKKWISDGRTRGVEFNTKTNIGKGILTYLTKSIVDHVDPRYYVLHSYNKWVLNERKELQDMDAVYQLWFSEWRRYSQLMSDRRGEFADAVDMIETRYRSSAGKDNIYYATSPDETQMSINDLEYFDYLLGTDSPYKDAA